MLINQIKNLFRFVNSNILRLCKPMTFLESNIYSLFLLYIPFKSTRSRTSGIPWLTNNLTRILKERDKSLCNYKTSHISENENCYNEGRHFELAQSVRKQPLI